MKIIFKSTLLIICLFASLATMNAATITWLGGNAAWNDASQWDTGTVPNLGDDVIIPSGYVKVFNGNSEKATSVEVRSSGRLYIYNGGALEIQGTVDNDALHNQGRVYIYGFLAINSITQTNPAFSANAIRNEGYIYTYAASQINIKYVDDIAIKNTSTFSYFLLRGGLWIYSVNNTAILNQDRFYNYGTIDIQNSGLSSGFLIVNSDDFKNYSGGEINLKSDIYGGFSNSTSNAILRNYGDINVEEVSIGINNGGVINNASTGIIEAKYNNSSGFYNRIGASLENYGQLKTYYAVKGLSNFGYVLNNNSISLINTYPGASLKNYSTGVIKNYSDINMNGDGYRDFENDGSLINYNGSYFEFDKIIQMSATGSITNYGFLTSHGTNAHSIIGSFANKGVIDDNHGLLQSSIANDRLIVAPVSGPMQVGVPYPNVLDVASLTDVSIGDWKVSLTGAIAGTYNVATNEFTPNASAVGISTLYISIQDLVSGNGRNCSLEIGSPIVPFSKTSASTSTRNGQNEEYTNFESAEIQVFPNPTSGMVQLKSKIFENNQTLIQIFNPMGQLVQQERLKVGNPTQSIDFSGLLTNGIYLVKMIQDGKELDMKRIQLFR